MAHDNLNQSADSANSADSADFLSDYVRSANGLYLPTEFTSDLNERRELIIKKLRFLVEAELVAPEVLNDLEKESVRDLNVIYRKLFASLRLPFWLSGSLIKIINSQIPFCALNNNDRHLINVCKASLNKAFGNDKSDEGRLDDNKSDQDSDHLPTVKRLYESAGAVQKALTEDFKRGQVQGLIQRFSFESERFSKLIRTLEFEVPKRQGALTQVFDARHFKALQSVAQMSDKHYIFGQIASKMMNYNGYRLSLQLNSALVDRVSNLKLRYPNFNDVIDEVCNQIWLNSMRPQHQRYFEPLLLNGPPGVGKTSFCRSLANAMGTSFFSENIAAATAGFSLRGADSQWGAAKPGKILQMLVNSANASNVLLLDEIDKLSPFGSNYPVGPVLLELLEPSSSRYFKDEFVQVDVDVSRSIILGTSNDSSMLDRALYSRFKRIEVSKPTPEQRHAILQSIITDKFHFARFEEGLMNVFCSSSLNLRELTLRLSKLVGYAVGRQQKTGGGRSKIAQVTVFDLNSSGVMFELDL